MFALGIAGWLVVIPHLRAESKIQQAVLNHTKIILREPVQVTIASPRSTADDRLLNFYQTLGQSSQKEQQIKAIFAIAGNSNLDLNMAEYKVTFNQNGGYQTYQMSFPLKGSYADIRRFCERLLLDIPFASLDEINFKREAINNPSLEAKLRITLYLSDYSMPASGVTASEHNL
ncbi:hypothetical protein CAter282_0427 [Collimonas arenae]|uniref:Uncharacterized protein n=2 Tax=Collimonas arenae TaxID=279058 RepID=A0A127QDU9_9BURK|nr:hypothetical protein CAter10_0457 [Collimonas arenae]AMP08243.1 hypothetical protein CAter282_0427 [Collimonas arenae]